MWRTRAGTWRWAAGCASARLPRCHKSARIQSTDEKSGNGRFCAKSEFAALPLSPFRTAAHTTVHRPALLEGSLALSALHFALAHDAALYML
jgi:hypothetical protein